MKHKYMIQKNGDDNVLFIKEYAELDKGIFSFVCEENYDSNLFKNVLDKGNKSFLGLLRTHNFFPPRQFAEQIAQAISTLLSSPDEESIELLCDDADFISVKDKVHKVSRDEEDDTSLDDFIEDDDNVESDFDETVNTMDGVGSIKIDTNPDDTDDLDANT